MTWILFEQIFTMFVIIIVGVIAFKAGLVTEKGNKDLSSLLLFVVNPILILLSYQIEFDQEKLKNLFLLMGLSFVTYLICIPVVNLLIGRKNEEYAIERFSAVYSNCGFFGLPLINNIYGLEGVFYLTAYLTAFNLCVWTHGLILMKGDGERFSLKQKIRNVLNPTVVACILGIVFYILRVTIPTGLYEGLDYVAKMNTPLAMLIAGVTLAQANIAEVLKNRRVYYIAFIRLLLCPLIVMGLMVFVPLDNMLKIILIISSACPVGATCTVFALRYDKNAVYASSLYVVTTILAVVTMPLLMALY